MRESDIDNLTLDELEDFLGLGTDTKICATAGCYNACERGYVICESCNHGEPERAAEVYVLAKKRLMRLQKARAKA